MEKFSYSDEELSFMESSMVPFAIYQFLEKRIYTVAISKGFIDLFGYTKMTKKEVYDLMDNNMYRDVHPKDIPILEDEAYHFATEDGTYDVIYRTFKNGEYRIIHAYGKHIYKENGARLAFISYMDQGVFVGDDKYDVVTSVNQAIKEKWIFEGEYNKLQNENERLKKEANANKKISELKKSVSALLTNMPAMTFSKDVVSGKYLACNQAFADYAHKPNPEGVIGLTDHDIFEEKTAYHFVEDDKKALSMDKPYIFYEDVLDAAGNPRQFQTTKLKFTDDTGRECLLGLCQDVTDAMRIKREYVEKLTLVQSMAEIDALTGIKNKNAYKEREELMNRRIQEHRQPEFAIVVLDVNNLKLINDTKGHEAGDKCICDACEIICRTFKRSPVFRVGGDEFVVISQDEDYERSEELVDTIAKYNEMAITDGSIVVACGMSKFNNDDCVADVFERADKKMYENKNMLKIRRIKLK